MSSDRQRSFLLLAGAAAAAGILAIGYQTWHGSRKRALFRQMKHQMLLDDEQLILVRDDFCRQMDSGLGGEPSSLLMIPSMVDIIPSGDERGRYLALDLGGTNFRCVYIKLGDGKGQIEDVKIEQCEIPEHHFTSPAADLFTFMAEKMVAFAKGLGFSKGHGSERPVVGFCFSFPCEHISLNSGKLIRWTKKFNNPGAVGQDPVQMLEDAFDRVDFPVDVDCMVNDTVGVLAAARYVDSSVMIGMILGTGTNACYVEKIDNVRKLAQTPRRRRQTMIINIEWGAFTSNTLPKLEFDRELDSSSANPGEMQLEKLTSGMYLGEVTRRILLQFAKETGLFGGLVPQLQMEGSLTTPDTSKIDHDGSFFGGPTADVLRSELGLSHWQTFWDRQLVRDIVRLVAQRSSQLIAAGIAALLRQMERDGTFGPMQRTVVAVDGGMFAHYRAFREELLSALERIMGVEAAHQIVLKHQQDGSSMGAVTMAGAAAGAPSQWRSEVGH